MWIGIGRDSKETAKHLQVSETKSVSDTQTQSDTHNQPMKLVEPSTEEVLAFCALDPVERVFLEDVARRGLGRFWAVRPGRRSEVTALCHVGANLVPSGRGCDAFA